MGNVTHDQHYVQRLYLSLWTKEKTTNGFAKVSIDRKEPKTIKITNILFEHYFYKLPVLNEYEIAVCKMIINSSPWAEYGITNQYIQTLSLNSRLMNCSLVDIETKKQINDMLKQMGEEFQKKAEKYMNDGLRDKVLNCDFSFMDILEEKYKFLAYVYMQYFRTPKVRHAMAENINNYGNLNNIPIDGQKIWSAVIGALASYSAKNMLEKQIYIGVKRASERTKFYTSDCPVLRFEISKDKTDRFLYPFSPDLALIISSNKEDNCDLLLSDQEVESINKIIVENSYRCVVYPPNE